MPSQSQAIASLLAMLASEMQLPQVQQVLPAAAFVLQVAVAQPASWKVRGAPALTSLGCKHHKGVALRVLTVTSQVQLDYHGLSLGVDEDAAAVHVHDGRVILQC
ncbi:unnamed protein product [Effrenium voratum]|nr:unnamed protein product [Effrenium voratum]